MSKPLVIVESPTKAKTIQKFLGKEFRVESSFGHVRDLPKSRIGIDVENGFEPKYIVPMRAKKNVTALKKIAKSASEIYFATDEDREGEAIAWHLQSILNPTPEKTKRIVFHEITKHAIEEAIEHPRQLDLHLVNAQQARRILDRLVGYELSPFLWKKVAKGLSAGRVQSVAVRLIVEREREREAFQQQEYWSVTAQFKKPEDERVIDAKLFSVHGKKLEKFDLHNADEAKSVISEIAQSPFRVAETSGKDAKRRPLPPFTTSTLQQAANVLLGFSSKQTMVLAQQLYEGIDLGNEGTVGLITYMRTDSVNLSETFLNETQKYLSESLGDNYATGNRFYKAKQKLAQEAHEAIRPTHVVLSPEKVKSSLDPRQLKLYTLIWNRAVASQMPDATVRQTRVDFADDQRRVIFRASGSVVTFDGFLKIFPSGLKEVELPPLKENDPVETLNVTPNQHFTEPPARYSEATLIKALEEHGIGRPSTYAPTLSTVQQRHYVIKEEGRFAPTDMGRLVNDVLVEHFPRIVDLQFTARMEDDLDEIANGHKEWQPVLAEFYQPFKENLMQKENEVQKKDLVEEQTDKVCEKCDKPMVIKMGRYGKFLACTGYPECKNTQPLNDKGEPEVPTVSDEKCPNCQKPLQVKFGRFGKFLGCTGYPDCKFIKKIQKSTGVHCDQCDTGEIVEKRSKRGKTFYACNQYPKCERALWSRPNGERCPLCSHLLIAGKESSTVCSGEGCTFKKTVTE